MDDKKGNYHRKNHRDHCQAVQKAEDEAHSTYQLTKDRQTEGYGTAQPDRIRKSRG